MCFISTDNALMGGSSLRRVEKFLRNGSGEAPPKRLTWCFKTVPTITTAVLVTHKRFSHCIGAPANDPFVHALRPPIFTI